MKTIFTFLLFAAISSASFSQDNHETESTLGQIIKLDNWETAKEKAKSENKNILIIMTGESWCKPCIKMERNLIKHPDFISFVNSNLIIFEINLPNHIDFNSKVYKEYKTFGEKYQTNALPSLILTDNNGTEKIKITNGTSSIENVIKKLKANL